jgi:tetratricopeptide (TPR) repeat protein
MCGTLLFDDAEKCTKCGNEMTEKPPEETAAEAAPESEAVAADEGTDESPEEAQEPAQGAEEESGTEPEEASEEDLSETSQQRKKWLEEQEKIKSELANIMGRVGTKKKPSFPPAPGVPAPGVAPNPAMTQVAPNPTAPGPVPQANPQAAPQPTPNTNVQNFNPAPTNSNAGVDTAAVPAPIPDQAPVPAEEGLSEVDKTELKGELDDLRNEGYNVSKLEKIIEENPGEAWKAFNDFLDDIDTLSQLKTRLENCNTDGFPDLEAEKNNLLSTMNDPDYMTQYEGNITQFENKLLAERSKAPEEEEEEDLTKKREAQLEKFIELGKEAFRVKNFEKALDMFTKADKLSPNNKEIVFFKKKVETKLAEQSGQVPAEAAAPGGAGEKKKKKKKKKKIVSRRSTPGAEVPGGAPPAAAAAPAAPPPAGAPPGQQPAPPGPAPGQAVAAEAGAEGDEGEGPRTAAEFEALGFNAYINKDYPKALEFYEKVLQIDPNFPNVQNIINECLMRLGKK